MQERPVSLLTWAYTQIKQMIFSGELQQGQKIVVSRLAGQLGISPTPVKEALNRLVAEGIMIALPRRGFQVKKFSHKEVQDIFECRIMLETFAAPQAIKNFPNHPEVKEEMRDTMQQLSSIDPHDYVGITHLEQRFHGCVIRLSENEKLLDLYNILFGAGFSFFVYMASYHPHKAQAEHQDMFRALETQDVDLLVSTLKEHLGRTIELYASFSQKEDQPQSSCAKSDGRRIAAKRSGKSISSSKSSKQESLSIASLFSQG